MKKEYISIQHIGVEMAKLVELAYELVNQVKTVGQLDSLRDLLQRLSDKNKAALRGDGAEVRKIEEEIHKRLAAAEAARNAGLSDEEVIGILGSTTEPPEQEMQRRSVEPTYHGPF